jgi:NAD(P)-dependent dehydrogenase (short-subunit alcohol dehydrogenase family)
VTDQGALERAVGGAVAALGGLDVVIANAGIATNGTVAITPVDALVRTIDVNLGGVVRTVSATLPHVTARRGYYLLVSSAAALAPLAGMSAYAASKSGVEQFGNVLRLEVARHGVGVGVAHPSWIDTDLVRDMQHDLRAFDATLRKLPAAFGTVSTVASCADAFVAAIERRARRVYVPRSLGVFAAARQLFASRLAELVMGWQARRLLPELEREVRALGRPFGTHSTGMGAASGMADDAPTEGAQHQP